MLFRVADKHLMLPDNSAKKKQRSTILEFQFDLVASKIADL
jgi:hypothetical protein